MVKYLRFTSLLFHPLFVPLYTVLLYFLATHHYYSSIEFYVILLQVTLITIVIPAILYLTLTSLRYIQTGVMVKTKKERVYPFLINIFLLLSLRHYIFQNNIAYDLNIYFDGLISNYLLLFLCLLLGLKLSVHTSLMTALLTFTLYTSIHYKIPNLGIVILIILATGLVASQRLYDQAHTSKEVILGGLCGLLPQVLAVYFYYNI